MPTLFSRSRTHSSPLNTDPSHPHLIPPDEFGRVSSRSSARNLPPTKKDKKRDKDASSRQRTISTTRDTSHLPPHPVDALPDGAFLPLTLDHPPRDQLVHQHSYGYLAYERHVVLGLEQVTRLVQVLTAELSSRGRIATPFIFSSLALDISATAIKRLIQAFLATCAHPGAPDADRRWRDEAKFAGPYELGMCLRWGLARVVRSVGGQDLRGLVAWDHYVQFRDSEAALHYPPSHFSTFLSGLEAPLQVILHSLFSLFALMTANSATSGHTPPTLSPLFGPLLFGLGPSTLAFHHTYMHYLWATNATEHLILAFIRWQDGPAISVDVPNTGSASSLGVPTRLKDWIRGYPTTLPFLKETGKNHKPQARKGARTVRVLSVRRNVRMYSPDLVKSAASWGQKPRPGVPSNERGLSASKEWDRIAPASLKLPPRYSDPFRKRMDMSPLFHPDTGTGPFAMDTASSSVSSGRSSLDGEDPFGLGTGLLAHRPGEDRFRSLTDLKWGEFEVTGFSGLGTDEKKLQFDLTEGARAARAAKRTTMSWSDFSNAGFSRNDVPLNATLQFSTPIATTISSWPSHNAELAKKFKKTQRSLPPFGWDTEPIIGSEEMVEEAFIDVFCDLVYGGGWMDLERAEEYDRDCNWAMVEFRALSASRPAANNPPGSDPRTATCLILFEEFVPLEYRQKLSGGSSNRRRLPSFFSTTGKSKQWKPAQTLNGRPYVVGHVPSTPSFREVEFEGLLRGKADTKVISLGSVRTSTLGAPQLPPIFASATAAEREPVRGEPPQVPDKSSTTARPPLFTRQESNEDGEVVETPTPPETATSPAAKRLSRFKLPVPNAGGSRKTPMTPAEYSTVEFETRVASYSDDDDDDGRRDARGGNGMGGVGGKRGSKGGGGDDESWMEILVANQDRRMAGQEAEFKRGVRLDPESASMEVAQALAAVLDRKPLSDDEADPEPVHEDRELVDEVQLIPRRIDAYDGDYFSQPEPEVHVYDQEESETQESAEVGRTEEGGDDREEDPALSGLSYLHQQKAQRRLGYFDIHPERRHATIQDLEPGEEEDDDDDDGAFNALVDSYVAPLVPRKTLLSSEGPELEERIIDRHGKRPAKPEPVTPTRVNSGGTPPLDVQHQPPPPLLLPPTLASSTPSSSSSSSTGKTAALIEMYRERERGGVSGPKPIVAAALPPSRLPVRALPTPPKEALLPPPLVLPPPNPVDVPLMDVPLIPIEETGRESPARYVHGRPLQNVLEEEEEEV